MSAINYDNPEVARILIDRDDARSEVKRLNLEVKNLRAMLDKIIKAQTFDDILDIIGEVKT